MGGILKILVLGLLAGLVCAMGGAAASEAADFKVLKLDGHNVRWPLPANGAGPVVSYSIVTATHDSPGARNCRRITGLEELTAASQLTMADARAEIAAAFAMWEAVANISFREAPAGTRADILIGAQVDPEGWAFADVFYDALSPEPVKPISQGLICLNPAKRWKIGFDGDLKTYDLRYTIAHEIGHAIGLDHPSGAMTIMGYRYEERFRRLQPGDVHGAVALYGEHRPATVAATSEPQRKAHPSAVRRFAKRWGTRAFTARSP